MTSKTGWRDTRLKNLFTSVRNGTWGDDPDGQSDVFCARGTDFDRTTSRIISAKMPRRSVAPSVRRDHELSRGDLVIEKSGGSADQPVGSVALFDLDVPTVCSNFNARMKVTASVDSRFACYLLNGLYWSGFTRQFIKQTTGIQNLDAEALLAEHCAIPPLDEQRRISDFLDVETSRIDQIVERRRTQINRLNTREPSLLDASYRADGSSFVRLKHLASRITSGPRGWGDLIADEGTPFLRILNIPRRGVKLDTSNMARVTAPRGPERERTRTKPGDILVSITADIGSVAIVDGIAVNGNVSQHIALVRPTLSICDPEWLAYAIKSPAAKGQLTGNSYGGTKVGLGLGDIADLHLSVPPLPVQRTIARHISQETAVIEAIRSAIEGQDALLTKRRQALIIAAVTGQFDVTTASRSSQSGGIV
ncbi:restriction endonuclease subunit S [Streptomyces sp. NPDC051218]|uniref:restriction endonuclease subunit S n=1 Tax=Streptomyces sp. NPDC051218 TaxID=3365645 RepID=UPI00379BDFEF